MNSISVRFPTRRLIPRTSSSTNGRCAKSDSAWQYRLGSRSALEWVLDQYKERKPRDPTIRERFNTYLFADHKERVIDLLQRLCTVSVETVRIVDQLAELSDIESAQTPPIP